jgi:aldose 1-epimerase
VTGDHVPAAPSGEQFEISFGDQSAAVVEVGGGLRTYSANGMDVLDGYALDEQSPSGRGQVLVPWPNRIQDGSYEFDGYHHRLPLTEPELGNAIHGLVRWESWDAVAREPSRVVMEHVVHPQPGYPFTLGLEIEYALDADGLSVRTTARNLGAQRCPYGCGQHPYLRIGAGPVDALELTAPGRRVLVHDERDLPVGSKSVDGTEFDFRTPRPIGETTLDNAFTDLVRDDDGRARVGLRDPGSGSRLTLWLDEGYPYLMLFTGDTRPDVNRRSLAVEPMSCPPNAFRSGDGLISLEPGQSTTATWGIAPSHDH